MTATVPSSGFYDVPTDMKYDGIGNLYVTGVRTTTATLQDYCTIKYDAGNGNTLWTSPAIYNYTNLIDIPAAITIGTTGRIIVAGGSGSTLTNWDFATIRYSPSTGAQVNVTRNPSNGLGFDQPTSIAKDQYDNIYVTGYSAITGNGYDIKIVKLDTGVDATGNVYVTGYTTKTNGGTDIVTLKYNNSGTLQWSKKYSAPDPTKKAIARKLDIDPYGNILIVGDAYNIGNTDILSLAYDVNGNKKWEEWFNGSGNGNDVASAIKIDDATNYFYVTGKVWTGSQFQYVTSKYQMIDYITPPDSEVCPTYFAYYQNKGQIINTLGGGQTGIQFYNRNDKPELFFSNTKVHFQFFNHDTVATTPDSSFRFDLQFESGLSSKVYSAKDFIPGYLNYFKPQCSTGATVVRGYHYLLMKEIYRNTDALISGNHHGFKVYYTFKPGSSTTSFVMNFNDATTVSIASNKIYINTSLGTVIFETPKAYQIDASGNKVALNWIPQYASAGTNKIKYTIGAYDGSLPLIIQMQKGFSPPPQPFIDDCPNNCEWSTFYEGTDDYNNDVRTDDGGNVYVVGTTFADDFAVSPGVIQTSLQGNADALVSKFDIEGHRLWSTYFGGNGNGGYATGSDYGYDVDVDDNGNVFFTGYTESESFLPQTSGNA
ncbi:MAG: SBBP repeat-containing protein, partial [Chitinophagales bacterium]